MIQSRWAQNTLLGFLVVVLVLLVWWGWSNGVRSAKSKQIVKDAQSMAAAFKEFHNDQNRYPATTEFQDVKVMGAYLSNFPPQNFTTELCLKSFDYFNATSQTYELRFCLPKAVKGFEEGWNTIRQ